jgi:hypothetical protein
LHLSLKPAITTNRTRVFEGEHGKGEKILKTTANEKEER